MPLDATATGIALGVIGSGTYAVLRGVRQQSFDVAITILVFLGLFSCPSGVSLIRAGLLGEPAALPSNWREHVAVAGIATIGLSVHYVVQVFRAARLRVIKSELGSADERAILEDRGYADIGTQAEKTSKSV